MLFKNKQTKEKSGNTAIAVAKYVTAALVVIILFWFGFTCQVREGNCAVILRFGEIRKEITDAGLYFKLPWEKASAFSCLGRRDSWRMCAAWRRILPLYWKGRFMWPPAALWRL